MELWNNKKFQTDCNFSFLILNSDNEGNDCETNIGRNELIVIGD